VIWTLLVWTLLVGLGIPGVVLAIRKLSWIDALVLEGKRPWACDVCMSFWFGGIPLTLLAALVEGDLRVLAVAPPAFTIALALLRVLQAPHAPPPSFPEE
jgi:hypothetical protein